AHGITVTNTIPAGMTFGSATFYGYDSKTGTWSTNSITPTVNGSQAIFALGDAPAYTYVYLYPIFHVDPSMANGTLLTMTVSESATEPDENQLDNSSSATVQVVVPSIDLAASVFVNTLPQNIAPDGQVQYILSYFNSGNVAAENVALTDTLPTGTTFVGNA